MKTILTLLLVVSFSVTGWANTNAMLRGIRIVETQDQLHPPRGKLGERGPYQFRRSTWRMHTSSSFDLAENRTVSNTVAKRHYAWIQAQLRAAGVDDSPYYVAAAWNAGVNAVIRGRIPAVSRDYATRVLNIAGTFLQPEPTPAEPTPETQVAETPKAQPLAPLTVDVTPDQSTSPVVADTAETPTAVPSQESIPVEYVYTVPPSASDPVQVRFHTSPIMLAFHSPSSAQTEPEQAAEAAPIALAANTQVGDTMTQSIGRM